ncbi:MAG: molecular chaperone [Monoraphidium minutum]|nr:MAG: molecular chaperone [Monoraphidium minutum]
MAQPAADLYEVLGVPRGASAHEIRRAFKTLRTKAHPDKGGDAALFAAVTRAHNRAHYDATGRVRRGADEAFLEAFHGGAYADPLAHAAAADAAAARLALSEQLVTRQEEGGAQSHTAGFEAWLRSRGEGGGSKVFGADAVAEEFGVAAASYDAVATLPRGAAGAGRGAAAGVVCKGAGPLGKVLALEAEDLPPELAYGEVLVVMLLAPVGPGDVYTAMMGGAYGHEAAGRVPFVAGHDGVGVVARVGPGVKGALAEGDLVAPSGPLMGTWRAAAVWRAKALSRVGSLGAAWRDAAAGGAAAAAALCRDAAADAAAREEGGGAAGAAHVSPADGSGGTGVSVPLPLEYLAVSRELVAAYRLLEMHDLKPGDCVVLNAPDSTVGRVVLQLSRLLRLRTLALLRPAATGGGEADGAGEARWGRVAERLAALGATHVLRDEGPIQRQLEPLRFFGRPALALDAVGGDSARRMADALGEGGTLVVYGCLSGKPPALGWKDYVFRGLTVKGFNARAWASARPARAARALSAVSRLLAAGLFALEFTEYDLLPEWRDAAEHAGGEGGGPRGGSRALLVMPGLPALAAGGGGQ